MSKNNKKNEIDYDFDLYDEIGINEIFHFTDKFEDQERDIVDIFKQSLCPKCNTALIENHTQFIKDYCPNCKDGLVYVIYTKTGKGKQCFFNDLIENKNKKELI